MENVKHTRIITFFGKKVDVDKLGNKNLRRILNISYNTNSYALVNGGNFVNNSLNDTNINDHYDYSDYSDHGW